MTPYFERDGVTIYHGEALAVLRNLPPSSVDAVITDPPYSSGGAFRGDRTVATRTKYVNSDTVRLDNEFAGDNRDQRGYAYWSALWLSEARRIARPGAPLCVFTDWRQLPTTTDAVQAGGWVWRGIVPWDKTEGRGRPIFGRFRSQCEYIVWGSNGPMPDRPHVPPLPGFFRQAGAIQKEHIAEKPLLVMAGIVQITEPGGTILEPFLGSGTTAAAALSAGYRVIGIEIDEHACEKATRRLEQMPLVIPSAPREPVTATQTLMESVS